MLIDDMLTDALDTLRPSGNRVGCDVVDIARFRATMERQAGFRDRVFTERERLDALRGGVAPGTATEDARLAARFAAKEATRKARADLTLGFHDTEVRIRPDGAPQLWLRGCPTAASVSLSHDAGVAIAVVVVHGTAMDDAPAGRPDGATPATNTAPLAVVPCGGREWLDLERSVD